MDYDKALPQYMQEGRERAHIGAGPYRHDVRAMAMTWRDYRVVAYQLDSLNPDTVIPVDLNVPATCVFGEQNDAALGSWSKYLAFFYVPESINTPELEVWSEFEGGYTHKQLYCHFLWDADMVIENTQTEEARDLVTGPRVKSAKFNAKFTNDLYTWNNKPTKTEVGVPGGVGMPHMGVGVDRRGVSPYRCVSQCVDDISVEVDGASRSWPLETRRYISSVGAYGCCLYIDLDGQTDIVATATITKWQYLCE